MKKTLCCLLSVLFLGACGCSKNPDNSSKLPSDKYETVEMATPFWLTNTMYNESVMLLSEDDELAIGTIAFAPTSKIVVRDSTLTKIYDEGKDYTFDKNTRTITRTENSQMPFITRSDIYSNGGQLPDGFNLFPGTVNGPTLVYTETPFYFEHQVFVTYEYDNTNVDNTVISSYVEGSLPNTVQKLKDKATLTMAVIGDSISEGANSSDKLNVEPFNPCYSKLLMNYFQDELGASINYYNASVGGTKSDYAVTGANQLAKYNPDLAIIAFGMNDANETSNVAYVNNIKAAMNALLETNPDCEFILIAPMLANPESAAAGMQWRFYELLESIVDDYTENSVVAVNMQTLHQYLLSQGKKYIDMSGNNVNHPNDFMMRMYTMNILARFWKF